MHMYHWFTLLYTWGKHNIVNQLHSNKKILNNINVCVLLKKNTSDS